MAISLLKNLKTSDSRAPMKSTLEAIKSSVQDNLNTSSLVERISASDFVQIDGKIWYNKQGISIPLYTIDVGRNFIPKAIHIEKKYCFLQVAGTVLCMNLDCLQDVIDGKAFKDTELLFDVFPGIDVGDEKRTQGTVEKYVSPARLSIGAFYNGNISVQFGEHIATFDTSSMTSTISSSTEEEIVGTIGAHSIIQKEDGEKYIQVGSTIHTLHAEIQELAKSIWEIYVKNLGTPSYFHSQEVHVDISSDGRVFLQAYECVNISSGNTKDIKKRIPHNKPVAPVLHTFDIGNIKELFTTPKKVNKMVDKDDRSIQVSKGWYEGKHLFYTGIDGKKYKKIDKKLVPVHSLDLQEYATSLEYYFSEGHLHSCVAGLSLEAKQKRKIQQSDSLSGRIKELKTDDTERVSLFSLFAPKGGRIVQVGKRIYVLVSHPKNAKKETVYIYNEEEKKYINVLEEAYEKNIFPEKDARFISGKFLPEESLTLSMADPVYESFIDLGIYLGKTILLLPISLVEKGIRKFLPWENSSSYFQTKESIEEFFRRKMETTKLPKEEGRVYK